MGEFNRIKVIESALEEEIPLTQNTLFMNSRLLDDLEFWERRLERLGTDYTIVEYEETTYEKSTGYTTRKQYGIFTNTKDEDEVE